MPTDRDDDVFVDVPTQRGQPVDVKNNTSPPAFLLGIMFVVIITFCMIGLPILVTDWKRYCDNGCYPNKESCNCNCYDGIAKGAYGRGGYKYIYFNMESTTFLIFSICVFYIILGQRAVESLAKLLFARRLSISSFLAFAATVFPNFYSCYMHFNYFNDNVHHLHAHQTFFSITELIVTYCIVQTADAALFGDPGQNKYLWVCFTISLTHMVQALKDNIFANLFLEVAKSHHLIGARDTAFLTCEVIILSMCVYRSNMIPRLTHCLKRDSTVKHLVADRFRRNLSVSITVMVILVVFLSTVTFGG